MKCKQNTSNGFNGSSLPSSSRVLKNDMKIELTERVTSRHSHSTLWLWMEDPVITDRWLRMMSYHKSPYCSIFSSLISTNFVWDLIVFSVAKVKASKTVNALLLSEHFKNTTVLENPSIPPWMTKCQRIILWLPSMCQTALAPFALYLLLRIAILRLKVVLIGSTLWIEAWSRDLGTLTPMSYHQTFPIIWMVDHDGT